MDTVPPQQGDGKSRNRSTQGRSRAGKLSSHGTPSTAWRASPRGPQGFAGKPINPLPPEEPTPQGGSSERQRFHRSTFLTLVRRVADFASGPAASE